jgi:hypothetical protein
LSLPSPNLTVPSLVADAAAFQPGTSALLLGPGTPFQFKEWKGLDKPDVRSGNQLVAQRPGAWPGTNQLKPRVIEATMDVGPPFGSYTNLMGALAALRGACSNEGSTEYPFWLQLPGAPLVCCNARVIKTSRVWDIAADTASLMQNTGLQWEATDPYFYGAPTQKATVGLPTPGVGFTFPIGFNLSFGGGSAPNVISAANNGDVACFPILIITGPCLNPTISNPTGTGNPQLSFNVQMNTGDQLVIDTRTASIVYYQSGSSIGTPQQQLLNSGGTFFSLPAGATSLIQFNSQDISTAAGTLTAWWADTYDSLI